MKGNYDYRFSFNNFQRGISDNPYLMQEGSFVDGRNIDIRKYQPAVGVAEQPQQGFTTGSREMYCAVDDYFFGENGYVYNTSGTNVLAITGSDIIGVSRYNDKYIWFDNTSSPRIGKVSIADTVGSSDRSAEPSYDNLRNPGNWTSIRKTHGSYGVSTLVFNGNLYFSNDNQVCILDSSDGCVVGLTCPDTIVGITVYGGRLKVYLRNGQILFWRGLEGVSWDEAIHIGQNIFGAFGFAGQDFIFTGYDGTGYTNLYKMNGYTLQFIKKGKLADVGVSLAGDGSAQHNCLFYDDIFFFPGGGSTVHEGIYTYGKAFSGMPEGLNYEYHIASTGSNYASIYCIHEKDNVVYIAYRDDLGTEKVDSLFDLNPSNYSDGWLVTDVFEGDDIKQYKSLAACELYASGRVIVEYRMNIENPINYNRSTVSAGTWTELFDTNNETFDEGYIRLYGQDMDITKFRNIQFRIKIYDTFTDFTIYCNNVDE